MSSRLEIWSAKSSLLQRRGRPPVSPRDGLVAGVTKPDATNTGVIPGIALETISSNVTLNVAGVTYENKRILGNLTITAKNVTVRNCEILGPLSPGASSILVAVTNANCENVVLQDCTIGPPQTPTNSVNGVVGHDFTLLRCNVSGTIDGINVHNTSLAGSNIYNSNVVIRQCYIHDLALYTAAAGGVVHPSDVYTHNDGIQHYGGSGTVIWGNNINCFPKKQFGHWYVTDPNMEPYVTVPLNSLPDGGPYQTIVDRGTGNAATGRYYIGSVAGRGSFSCLMINSSQGQTLDLDVKDNWMYGGGYSINGGITRSVGNLGNFRRNRFDHSQGQQSTGGNNTHTITVNPSWSGFCTTNAGTADKNYYEDNNVEINFRFA